MPDSMALGQTAVRGELFDGAFLFCTACKAVHRVTGSDRAPIYLPDGTIGYYDERGRLFSVFDSFGNTVSLNWETGAYDDDGILDVQQSLGNSEARTVSFTVKYAN